MNASSVPVVGCLEHPIKITFKTRTEWPFKTMAVGDWFRFTGQNHNYARVRAASVGPTIGAKFSCRKDADGSLVIIRVS